MMLHSSFIARTARYSCFLLARFRLPFTVVAKRNTGAVVSKQDKQLGHDKSILEKVLLAEPQSASQKAIITTLHVSGVLCVRCIHTSVKEKATNAYLYTAYLLSLVVMGGMAYLLYEEILAPGAPQTVFSKALSLIKKDPECCRLLGDSIVGYVEGRGRIKQVAHHSYKKNENDRVRVMFNVKGNRCQGIVTAEMEKNGGKWNWRFLVVTVSNSTSDNIIVVDNR
ncbi:unnamed protein product [Thelazia callipaeda]|uniref:Mitochondrial import inner membrane translocase subunit Tim21 n=1 Tax=Thelazia callipaeda TaxID=103827 RepID=A0A0N5CZ56_THECL|nr:unnamed protein product [Thelazia callipaeda]